MNNQKRGFTLVEMLVVIVIVGILAVAAIVSLRAPREKTYLAQVQATLVQVVKGAALCLDGDGTLVRPADRKNGGGPICTGADVNLGNWPSLEKVGDWRYCWGQLQEFGTSCDQSDPNKGLVFVFNSADDTFQFGAVGEKEQNPAIAVYVGGGENLYKKYVRCTQTGCTTGDLL